MNTENKDFTPMPENLNFYNGSNERCDMLIGPCSCGAWHKREDWKDEDIKKYITEDENQIKTFTEDQVVHLIMDVTMMAMGDAWIPQEDEKFKDFLASYNLLNTWEKLYDEI